MEVPGTMPRILTDFSTSSNLVSGNWIVIDCFACSYCGREREKYCNDVEFNCEEEISNFKTAEKMNDFRSDWWTILFYNNAQALWWNSNRDDRVRMKLARKRNNKMHKLAMAYVDLLPLSLSLRLSPLLCFLSFFFISFFPFSSSPDQHTETWLKTNALPYPPTRGVTGV